jgi:hypothetical protein
MGNTMSESAIKNPAMTVTKTFSSPKDAIKNARKLLDAGEISHADFARIEKKLIAEDHEGDLKAWLAKTYGPREEINPRADSAMLGGPPGRR